MKFKNTSAEYQSTIKVGKKMGFAPEAESFLMDMMSDGLYSDKFGSIVREIASNCIDANVEAGSTDPVSISVTAPSSFTNSGEIVFQDSGVGICPDRIEDIFTLYFASTKRDGNDMIGGFGIGAKSPFAYTDVFRVETWCNGNKYTYLLEKRGQDRTCTLLDTAVEEGKGTKIRIPVKDKWDYEKFVDAINEQTMLMRPLAVTLSDNKAYESTEVFEFENFFVSRDRNGTYATSKVALGNVVYPVDKDVSGEYLASCSIIPKLEIGSCMPTMSRESIQMTDDTKAYIKKRYQDSFAELQAMADGQRGTTTSILEFIKDDSRFLMTLDGTDVEIDLRFGGYGRATSIKKENVTLEGFEGVDRHMVRSYAQSVCEVTAQYTQKYSGSGSTWRNAKSSDSSRYHQFVVDSKTRNYNDPKPLFIRWKAEDKLTPADKEVMEEMLKEETDYTSIHLIQRRADFPVGGYTKIANFNEPVPVEGAEALRESLWNKFGKKILVELMDRTDKFEDWQASPEYIAQRKEAMKALRTKTTKKDRSKTQYRLRGIGRKGVYDFELKDLQRMVRGAVLYMTSKEVNALKEVHKESDCRWMDFSDWVFETFEKPANISFFAVSEKAAKEFKEMGVFVDYVSWASKQEARKDSDIIQLRAFVESFRSQPGAPYFIEACVQADESFAKVYNQVMKLDRIAHMRGVVQTGTCPEGKTTFSYMNHTVSIAPIVKMLDLYNKRGEGDFLTEAICNMRSYGGHYKSKCEQAFALLMPNKQK